MNDSANTEGDFDAPEQQSIADLYALLSRCFQHPDETLIEAVRSGHFEETLRDSLTALDVELESPPTAELADLRESYLSTFEAYDGEYAPPVESAYEEWWDGTERELLSGPPAHDMRRRCEAVDAEVPPEYPADHASLLLEYGSLVLEAGNDAEYAWFHADHFDWIPSLRQRVENTSDSPFYRWAVALLDEVTEAVGEEFIAEE